MPIQIKKPQIKPYDKKFRKSLVGLLIMTVVFLATLFSLIKYITDTESKIATTALFAAYILYIAANAAALVLSVKTYKREDNFGAIFQGVFIVAALVFCAMNLRFAFIMLFSAFNLDTMVNNLLGSLTSDEFIQSQYACWICMLIGTLVTTVLGVSAVVKLLKNKHN